MTTDTELKKPATKYTAIKQENVSTKIRFPNRDGRDFHKAVTARVNAYFKDNGISVHANWKMYLKTAILLGSYFGFYFAIISGQFSIWAMWLMAVGLGVATAGIGFSVAHDAIHGAYFKNKNLNYLLGLSMNLIGGNRYVWSITHNVVHHTYTNIHDHDEDLEVASFIRLSPHAPRKPIHRFQHILAFFAYGLASIFWVFLKDYKKMAQKNIGPYDGKKHPTKEIVMLIATKLVYYAYIIVIPLLVMDIAWWQFIIGFLTVHLTAGIILGVVFQMAHTVENVDQPLSDAEGRMEDSWAVHQMKTTGNFAMKNAFINWYVGGLNFQVEHHLFPNICSIHYTAISPIVKQTAEEYGVPYNYYDTFGEAIASHYRQLKKWGKADSVGEMKMA
jgi:linoleoyl-CoA desaturase